MICPGDYAGNNEGGEFSNHIPPSQVPSPGPIQ